MSRAKALSVLPLCLSGDLQSAMNKLHTEDKPAKPEAAVPEPEKKGLFSGLIGGRKK